MSICFDDNKKIFKLDTQRTTYMIGLTQEGYVGHVYYGARLESACAAHLLRTGEPPFTPSVLPSEKAAFLDTLPMEYPTGGVSGYRETALELLNELGQNGCELFYRSYTIEEGKPELEGLPSSFKGAAADGEVMTLRLLLEDPVLNVTVELRYSVFEKEDVITRSAVITNAADKTRTIRKAYSACLDLDNEDMELITLTGAWGRERHIERQKVRHGRTYVGSTRGYTSHQEHPFIALVTPETTQKTGSAYAMHFVYSGNFRAQAELSQWDNVRMTMGIDPDRFTWVLDPGCSFTVPECVLTYSECGLGRMSRNLHDFYRNHMIRSPWLHRERPILINNWEATYFNFDTDKLLSIAREAKKCGIEMLVMDDGWFGHRNLDDSSLGDWYVNEEKIKGGLKYLTEEVNKIGLKFGIWFEPEAISPDSDLFRAHPDWALQISGREGTLSRGQYVLDYSRKEVRDAIYDMISGILRSANIDYVKWDMNRSISDIGNLVLPPERQQEISHRYVLGVYELQERLTKDFPDLLLENCAGGGARFDPGMLYYSPQIWCSDDMDSVERLRIQEGTELAYPLSVMGAHVCCAPNHTTGRILPFETRGHVALSGTFGYELDITKIPDEDREMIPAQTQQYHQFHALIADGDYYRIHSWNDERPYDCWGTVAKDGSEALFTYVQVLAKPNQHSKKIRLDGLDPQGVYELRTYGSETKNPMNGEIMGHIEDGVYTGEELMKAGILAGAVPGDYRSRLWHLVRK